MKDLFKLFGCAALFFVLGELFLLTLVYFGFGAPSKQYCEDVLMVERRFGVDIPLSELSNVPQDHLIYKQKQCVYVDQPRKKETIPYLQFLKEEFTNTHE